VDASAALTQVSETTAAIATIVRTRNMGLPLRISVRPTEHAES
jgi:hypothetical protein